MADTLPGLMPDAVPESFSASFRESFPGHSDEAPLDLPPLSEAGRVADHRP